MKKVLLTAAVMALIGLPCFISAQDITEEKTGSKVENGKKEKIETEEIIIRNKGDKELNLKVEINGDKVIVNGKPLAEFKDEQVTINKRKMIIRDGDDVMAFSFNGEPGIFQRDFIKEWKGKGMEKAITRPFLGVTTEKTDEGAKITEVVKASAAEKAGLKKDDIITKVADQKVVDGESLSELISSKKAKEAVKITYLRNGKESTVKATLGERKVSNSMTFNYGPHGDVRAYKAPRMPGTSSPNVEFFNGDILNDLEPLAHGDLTPYAGYPFRKKIGLKIQDTDEGGNVKVIDVEEGSAAEKAGLKKDDIITEIGGKKVANTDEAREQLNPAEAKSSYTVKALRGGTQMSFDIKIPKKLKTANL